MLLWGINIIVMDKSMICNIDGMICVEMGNDACYDSFRK